MPRTISNGRVCYIELPADDVKRSSDFYANVFGWKIRQRTDGRVAFDDTAGQISGTWVTGRPAASEPGLLVYIMVDNMAATVDAVTAHGGEIAQPLGGDATETTVRFRDPGGNIMGLYQERRSTERRV